MTVLKLHINPHALKEEDKLILSDFIHANFSDFMEYCEEQHCTKEQFSRIMNFVDNHGTPFNDSDVDI